VIKTPPKPKTADEKGELHLIQSKENVSTTSPPGPTP
jgi:hypothetical protein